MPKPKGAEKAPKKKVTNGWDPAKAWEALTDRVEDSFDYLKKTSSEVMDALDRNVTYLTEEVNLSNIQGGAAALVESISSGNLGKDLSQWVQSEDTPLVAKAAGISGVLMGAVLTGKAGAAAGAAAVSIKAIVSTTVGKFAASGAAFLMGKMAIETWMSREAAVEKGFSFFETAVEVDINQSVEKFFEKKIKELKELLKTLASSALGLAGRNLARIVVRDTGGSYLEVDRQQLGLLSLTVPKKIYEDVCNELSSIASALGAIFKTIASEALVVLLSNASRDTLLRLGMPGITAGTDQKSTTLSDLYGGYAEQTAQILDIPDWLFDGLGEGTEEYYDELRNLVVEAARKVDSKVKTATQQQEQSLIFIH